MEPIALFGIQFTLSLVAYALLAFWYVTPRLSALPREVALAPLLWIHAFRVVGGTILAPGSVDAGVAMEFRTMMGDRVHLCARIAGEQPPCHHATASSQPVSKEQRERMSADPHHSAAH